MSQHIIKQLQELKQQVSLLQEAGEPSQLEERIAAIEETNLQNARHINSIYTALQQAGVELPADGQPAPQPGLETTYMEPDPSQEETRLPAPAAAATQPVPQQLGYPAAGTPTSMIG